MSALAERVDKFFKITERGSTLRIELWAAVANFTANAYLLVLVPELLAAAGVKRSASLFGFVVATFVSSSIVGLVGNLPVAMGPGTGAATYFSIHFAGSDPRLGLTVCFLSGVLMFLLAAFNLPRRLFDYCPFSVKNAMPMGLGLYLSLCGLQKLGIVVAGNGLVLGDVAEPSVIVGMMGILLMVYMEHLRSGRFFFPQRGRRQTPSREILTIEVLTNQIESNQTHRILDWIGLRHHHQQNRLEVSGAHHDRRAGVVGDGFGPRANGATGGSGAGVADAGGPLARAGGRVWRRGRGRGLVFLLLLPLLLLLLLRRGRGGSDARLLRHRPL